MEAFLWSEGWLLRLPGSKGKKILIYFCWMLKWKYGLLGSFNYSNLSRFISRLNCENSKQTNEQIHPPFPDKRERNGAIFFFFETRTWVLGVALLILGDSSSHGAESTALMFGDIKGGNGDSLPRSRTLSCVPWFPPPSSLFWREEGFLRLFHTPSPHLPSILGCVCYCAYRKNAHLSCILDSCID